eukprot:scaffold56284_cov50-Prasinocladus_malaysianus.AAC.1
MPSSPMHGPCCKCADSGVGLRKQKAPPGAYRTSSVQSPDWEVKTRQADDKHDWLHTARLKAGSQVTLEMLT